MLRLNASAIGAERWEEPPEGGPFDAATAIRIAAPRDKRARR